MVFARESKLLGTAIDRTGQQNVLASKKALAPPLSFDPPPHIPCHTLDPLRTAVEVSNFPPTTTKLDIRALFAGFRIADFQLRTARSFSAPLRVRLEVAGSGEAERAARELNAMDLRGRRVCVTLADETPFEIREAALNEIADELKIQIINTARIHHEQHSTKILVVRECMTATLYYAFLQGRDPLTIANNPNLKENPERKLAKWYFVAAGTASAKDPEGRLKALKDLQSVLEEQGKAFRMWESWEGSELLKYDD